MSRDQTLLLSERLSAATHLAATLELLARSDDRNVGGINDWSISRRNVTHRGRVAAKLLDLTSGRKATTALHLARAGAAVFLLLPTGRMHRARLAANAVITGAAVGTFHGQLYGSDGSDQASLLVQSAATVARSSRDPRIVDAALWFLSLQSTLNYAASGWVKMVSPTWRSGRAMPGVMRTTTYGHQGAWKVATRHPRSAKALGHGVLAMECLFPAVFAVGGRLAPAFVGSAAAFHLANAGLMGLGRFVGAFSAMHPAVLYTTDPRRRSGDDGRAVPRSDVLPAVAGAMMAAALAVGTIAQQRRRREVLRARPDDRRVTTRSGNVLTVRVDNPGAGGPVIFFETALAATDEHWEWIRRDLAGQFTTVVYQRAGYGSSQYRNRSSFALADAVDDFVDLVNQVAGDRRVVIVGHSLGGYLAMRSAERLGDQVPGVVLVEASHPGQLARSARQEGGATMLDSTMRLMAPSMRLGLGSLLETPAAFNVLPDDARTGTLAQYRDARLWSAAHREWKATRSEFGAFDGQLPKLSAQMLVIAAGKTVEDDPVQAELNRELADVGTSATVHTIDGAFHDTIITSRPHADAVGNLITTFVRGLAKERR